MLALVLAAAATVSAAPGPDRAPAGDGVCLALSGGGARGLAHIGVLQALEDEGVRVRCVAGTSMGSLVGALYVGGYSPARMRDVVRSLEWQRVFSGRPERALVPLALRVDETAAVFRFPLIGRRVRLPPARDSDYRINRFLFQLLAEPGFRMGADFDRFPVPLRTVATGLGSGERVVIAEGSLARAVRASLSTPVNLVPVTVGGRLVVDGGLVDNLPTDVAREMGPGPVVAVDVRSTPLAPHAADSFVDTTAVVIDQLMRARNDASFTAADLTIDLRPALTGLRASDYLRHEDAFAVGLREGRVHAGAARALAGGGRAGARAAAGPALEGARIAAIEVRGADRVRHSVITRAFGKPPGGLFRMDDVLRRMDAVYATELFESVWLDAAPAPSEGAVITVEVQEAPRAVVEAGGGYDPGDNARGFLRVRNRNLFGRGERIDTTGFASEREFGAATAITAERPFGLPVGIFLRAHLLEEKPRVFREHQSLGRAEFDRRGIIAGLQRQVGAAGLVRVGAEAGEVRTRAVAGVPFAAGRDRIASLLGEAAWDTLDDRALPRSGAAVSLSGEHTVDAFGNEASYSRFLAQAQAAASRGSRVVARAQALAATSSGDVPVYEEFRLGGPVLLPGFHRDELWGRHALAGSLSAGVAVAGSLRLVARAGAGNAWGLRRSARLSDLQAGYGLGMEVPTRIGPFTVDWGRSAHGVSRVDIALGLPREQSLIR